MVVRDADKPSNAANLRKPWRPSLSVSSCTGTSRRQYRNARGEFLKCLRNQCETSEWAEDSFDSRYLDDQNSNSRRSSSSSQITEGMDHHLAVSLVFYGKHENSLDRQRRMDLMFFLLFRFHRFRWLVF